MKLSVSKTLRCPSLEKLLCELHWLFTIPPPGKLFTWDCIIIFKMHDLVSNSYDHVLCYCRISLAPSNLDCINTDFHLPPCCTVISCWQEQDEWFIEPVSIPQTYPCLSWRAYICMNRLTDCIFLLEEKGVFIYTSWEQQIKPFPFSALQIRTFLPSYRLFKSVHKWTLWDLKCIICWKHACIFLEDSYSKTFHRNNAATPVIFYTGMCSLCGIYILIYN